MRAARFFTKEEDGLTQAWHGRVWMNHPFGRQTNKAWIQKLVESLKRGEVEAGVCICFASMSEKWFEPLLEFPQCFPRRRINYFLPDGTKKRGVTKGSVVTYLGRDLEKFKSEFAPFGAIKVLA